MLGGKTEQLLDNCWSHGLCTEFSSQEWVLKWQNCCFYHPAAHPHTSLAVSPRLFLWVASSYWGKNTIFVHVHEVLSIVLDIADQLNMKYSIPRVGGWSEPIGCWHFLLLLEEEPLEENKTTPEEYLERPRAWFSSQVGVNLVSGVTSGSKQHQQDQNDHPVVFVLEQDCKILLFKEGGNRTDLFL